MAWCTGRKSTHSYGGHEITDDLYKLSVSIWILLGLASCACVITTLKDTYSAIVWHIHEKAVTLTEKAKIGGSTSGSADPQQSSSSWST